MINTVINGNCMEIMKNIPKNSVDLIIADPFFNDWDKFYELPLDCLKEDGVFIAFSNRPHTGRLQVKLDKKMKFLTELVWNFTDGRWVSHKLPRICHENILVYTKSKKNPLNDTRIVEWIEKPKAMKKGAGRIGKWSSGNGHNYEPKEFAQMESVIFHTRTNGGKDVDKEVGVLSKPKELIKLLLNMASQEGDTILDCFSGSGIIPIVCKEMNRNYIAIEIDEKRTQYIKERLNTNEEN